MSGYLYELSMKYREVQTQKDSLELVEKMRLDFFMEARRIIANEAQAKLIVLEKLGIGVKKVEVRHDEDTACGAMVKLDKGVYARIQQTDKGQVFFVLCNKVGTIKEGTEFQNLAELSYVLEREAENG